MRNAQIARLQKMTFTEKLAIVEPLIADTVRWSRNAIRDSIPAPPESEVILRWIELVYGKELATRIAPSAARSTMDSTWRST